MSYRSASSPERKPPTNEGVQYYEYNYPQQQQQHQHQLKQHQLKQHQLEQNNQQLQQSYPQQLQLQLWPSRGRSVPAVIAPGAPQLQNMYLANDHYHSGIPVAGEILIDDYDTATYYSNEKTPFDIKPVNDHDYRNFGSSNYQSTNVAGSANTLEIKIQDDSDRACHTTGDSNGNGHINGNGNGKLSEGLDGVENMNGKGISNANENTHLQVVNDDAPAPKRERSFRNFFKKRPKSSFGPSSSAGNSINNGGTAAEQRQRQGQPLLGGKRTSRINTAGSSSASDVNLYGNNNSNNSNSNSNYNLLEELDSMRLLPNNHHTPNRAQLQIPLGTSSPPLSPMSPISNYSYKSDDESESMHSLGVGVGGKISNKWQIHRHNFDKSDENDPKLLEFNKFLTDHYYDAFNYNWQEIAEMYTFGGLISKVFSPKRLTTAGALEPTAATNSAVLGDRALQNVLMNWLLLGGDTQGDEQFALLDDFVGNIDLYAVNDSGELNSLLKFFAPLVKALDVFKQAVAYFKENTDDNAKLRERNASVEILEKVADKKGLPIPLAQALLANWLIQFNSDDNNQSNGSGNGNTFSDERIMQLFRKSARNSLVIKYLYVKGYFTQLVNYLAELEKQVSPTEIASNSVPALSQLQDIAITNQELQMFVQSFLLKDNQTSLGLSLYGIANAVHLAKQFNKAINVFELSANLTFDLDCCAMAAEGLSAGFGFGRKHGKENKFHRKKRIAKIYRIMKENGGTVDVGTSWAFKDKYD